MEAARALVGGAAAGAEPEGCPGPGAGSLRRGHLPGAWERPRAGDRGLRAGGGGRGPWRVPEFYTGWRAQGSGRELSPGAGAGRFPFSQRVSRTWDRLISDPAPLSEPVVRGSCAMGSPGPNLKGRSCGSALSPSRKGRPEAFRERCDSLW